MGPFLLVLLVSSGVSVFSLAPEPSDDEVSSTSSLVSRLKQVKTVGKERRGRHQTVGKERRGRHQYFLFYDTPPSPSPSPTTESQPLIVHHHYHNYTTDNTASGGGGTSSSAGGGGASAGGGSISGGPTGGGGSSGGGGVISVGGSTGGGGSGDLGGGIDYVENDDGSGEENEDADGSGEGSGGVQNTFKQRQQRGCKCGVLNPTSRISGGTISQAFRYRWLVVFSIEKNEIGDCAGTLIADQWVLTAAHCVLRDEENYTHQPFHDITDDYWKPLSVVIGEHRIHRNGFISKNDPSDLKVVGTNKKRRKRSKVIKAIVHKDYNPDTNEHDIALLKLRRPLNLFAYPPACLPSPTVDAVGKKAIVAGWGAGGLSVPSEFLREAEQEIISNEDCEKLTHTKPRADMLCAKTPETSPTFQDACKGDSGGPLIVDMDGNGTQTLIGVVSHGQTGDTCTQTDENPWYPGTYSSVPQHVDWIREKIEEDGDGNFCDP